MKRRPASEQSRFSIILALVFFPAVFLLTKIGEYTVRAILAIGRLFVFLLKATVGTIKKFARFAPLFKYIFERHPLSHIEQRKGEMFILRKKRPAPTVIYVAPLSAKIGYLLLGVFSATLFLTPVIVRLWLSDLPNPNHLAMRDLALSTKLYDRNGKFLFQFYANQNRTNVPLSDIPKTLIDATIAIEDKNFYHHSGFDLLAMIRAARETLINKHIQGGSTITQQLVKSVLLTPDITLERKVKEIILAFMTEKKFTKDQILAMYFNQVPYGGTAWGIEAASQTYFGKSVKDLDLAESALLAGLPSGPTIYSPFGTNPQLAKKRQEEVLNRMVTLGFVTREEADLANSEVLSFAAPVIDIKAPHFTMYVKDYLVARYGIHAVEKGGLRVRTTLDLDLEERAAEIVQAELEKLTTLSVSNGAAFITNPQTGEILAMVGSHDYFDTAHNGNVNVTTSLRQPGSSIKLVMYAAAMERGFTASSMLDDSPITYSFAGSPSYSPINYDGRFHGKVTLRDAFGNSYNVPAVKTLAHIGVAAMIDMGKRLGITTWNDINRFGLSLTLGGGEVKMVDLATAYGTIANGGIRRDLTPVLKITDPEGNILEENPHLEGRRVLSEGIAFILSDILADNSARAAAFGPNSVLNIAGQRISVKTGTSDNKRDNWTIGFNKNLLVAVWVGNMDNSPMHPSLTSGITGAAPIWNRLITTAMTTQPATVASQPTTPPVDVIAVPICRINGLLPCGGCPTRTEYFIAGTQPKLACKPEFLTPAPAIGGAEPTATTH